MDALTVVAYSSSNDVSCLALIDGVWSLLDLDSLNRVELPVPVDDEDNGCCGLFLDYSAREQVKVSRTFIAAFKKVIILPPASTAIAI